MRNYRRFFSAVESDVMGSEKKIHIGTSGWHYKHWQGPFYPEDVPTEEYLKCYTNFFHTVEINNTFYNLPDKKTIVEWRKAVPRDFIFSVKASRYITHMKKFKEPRESVEKFLGTVQLFKHKLGPILFQLPPRWRVNPERLENFVESLPDDFIYTFEFRDPSWFDPRIYEILEKNNMSFCMYEIGGLTSPKIVTADFIYIRLHGPGEPYKGQYSTQELSGWAGALSTWKRQGKEIYIYFDNDEAGYAPQDAIKLQNMLSD